MADGAGAISPPYTDITDSTLSAGKPWTQTLARTLRDDVDHVHALIHDPVSGHSHDGVNSPLISAAASIILPDSVSLKASGSSSVSWTSVSIAADTGANTAKIAVLCARMSGATAGLGQINLRKTGTSPASPRQLVMPIGGLSGQLRCVERTIFVPLDGSEQFDYQAVFPGGDSWDLYLEGWII